ncbi:MAG: DUF3313 domain-containing protein [Alphaproteobacteria bacterium]
MSFGAGLLCQSSALAQEKPLIDKGRIIGGSTGQMRDDVRPVGKFLPQPALLRPGGAGQPVLVYRNPGAAWQNYNRVMLDRVSVMAGPESQLRSVSENYRRGVANYFNGIAYNALSTRCTMVSRPGPGTMRIRIALVDAKTPNKLINTAATYTPYASTAYSVASRVFNKGVGYFAGNATAQAYAVDAQKGTLLWQAVDKRGGTTALVADTTDDWRDVRKIFETWGQQMAERLAQLGVCR